ncbi:Hsp70 family protein [Nonomuraea sp. NPDC048901]|uniref:Hsp70 family protein n=1 Tax=Nonomuraea sp. NPDC048901 TaxID=3155627 RepID=UPI0033FDF229
MTAFGIDLGTTNSCIACVDESGRPVVLPNAIGELTTPSVVYFDQREKVWIGRAAKDAALLAPDLAVQLVKRQMGHEGVEFTFHGTTYTPESVSALILKELASAAQRHLDEPVRDVVITVPASFGVAERTATLLAGEIAGLNVLDILDEPNAAALSYRERTLVQGTRHLLVYDLGGGTFDTTVVRVDGEHVKVICTGGEPDLGGADWDTRVRDFLLDTFTRQHPRLDPTADPQFMKELSIRAEQLKEELSTMTTRRRSLAFAGAAVPVELSRRRLEELTADLLDRTLDRTKKTIAEARRKGVPDVDEVILVGGMTRMPAIMDRLEKLVGKALRRHEPDLAVARGAAMFALLKHLEKGTRQDRASRPAIRLAARMGLGEKQADKLGSQRATTVLPRGFGTKVLDINDPLATTNPALARTYVVRLIPAGTALPADTGPVTFHTAVDNQPGIEVEVWEQASEESSEELADNKLIGRGKLRDLPPKLPKHTPVEITFFLSETGLLTVNAVEPASGRQVRFDLQVGGLDRSAVDQARTSVARHDTSS